MGENENICFGKNWGGGMSGAYIRGIGRGSQNAKGIKITPVQSDQMILLAYSGDSTQYGIMILSFYNGNVKCINHGNTNIVPRYENGAAIVPVSGWACGIAASYLNFNIAHYNV